MRVAVYCGEMQRGIPLLVHHVYYGVLFTAQLRNYGGEARRGGHVKRAPFRGVLHIQRGFQVEQHLRVSFKNIIKKFLY